jgi:hypothetical protein
MYVKYVVSKNFAALLLKFNINLKKIRKQTIKKPAKYDTLSYLAGFLGSMKNRFYILSIKMI